MSVYRDARRKRNKWVWEFRLRGVRYNSPRGYSSRRRAEAAERAFRQALEAPAEPPPPAEPPVESTTPTTFLELATAAMRKWEEAAHDPQWLATKRYVLRRYFREWMMLPVSEITPELVKRRVLEIKHETSPEAANRYLKILRAVFNAAGAPNPTAGIPFFPRMEQPAGEYVPTAADIKALLLKADPELRAYLEVSYHTAARPFEIARLAWKDVDFARGTVTLWTRKKSRDRSWTPREIPMNDTLRRALRQLRSREGELVFPNPRTGAAYMRRPKALKTLCRKAGIRPFCWRGLRKAAATEMLRAGVPVPVISKILGHTNIQTTMIYLGVDDDAMRWALAALNGIVTIPSGRDCKFPEDEKITSGSPVEAARAEGAPGRPLPYPRAAVMESLVGKEGFEPSTSCSRSQAVTSRTKRNS